MQYEYKVDHISADVNDTDLRKGIAGQKVAGQVEIKISEWTNEGWEFYRSDVVPVTVNKTGCFGGRTGEGINISILFFVFRREVR